ncbi:MAG: TetR/AcrR family transcriptional regulator [Negativicutes bacterium]|nr:TetR/AcrR family transcriptional regulator [Negativicutes bacterium]
MSSRWEAGIAEDCKNKRQQILEAAYIVFSRKGYHRATVDEIIALADTGKGTVYNYFNNKEQLFYTLIKEISEPFEAKLEAVVADKEPPVVKIKTLIRLFLEFYTKNADLWRVMMHEVRGFGSEGYSRFKEEQREKYRERFRETIGCIDKVLQEAIACGDIKPCDTAQVSLGLFSVIVAMVFQKLVDPDLAVTAEKIAGVFLYGIARQQA